MSRQARPRRRSTLGRAGPRLRPRTALGALALALAATFVALPAALPGGAALARSGSAQRPAPRPTPKSVPAGFVGVDVDGPLVDPGTPVDLDRQVSSMVAEGVQSVRVAFSWADAQPFQRWSDVPAADTGLYSSVGGRPTSFAASDRIVAAAVRRRLTVLPTILYAPAWDARPNPAGFSTPERTAPYAEYAAALVGRYGPHGSFWLENPALPKAPIEMWQVWNEPNLPGYWPQPFARSYVALLRITHDAIKRADPGAKIVLGALTNLAWRSLGEIDKLRDTRRLYDVVSVNGFTRTPADVIEYLRLTRNAMITLGQGAKPLLASELSWPSARGRTHQHFDFVTTEAGQARDIAQLLPMIGRQRARLGLIGFYYYTWIGDEGRPYLDSFRFSGLLRFEHGRVRTKPALAAFRAGALALEQCRQKGAVATSCRRPLGR